MLASYNFEEQNKFEVLTIKILKKTEEHPLPIKREVRTWDQGWQGIASSKPLICSKILTLVPQKLRYGN